jgi:hypothetical protein
MKNLKKHNWRAILIAMLMVILAWGSWAYLGSKTNQAQTQRELESKEAVLNQKLKELEKSQLDVKQLEGQKKLIETQKQEVEKQLQAKKSTSAVYAASAPTKPVGNCQSWMAQAGIAQTDATNKLILKESGCNPTAQNPRSTAYGIGQFLDSTWATVGCSKTSDPVVQLQCMQKYVIKSYGSWDNALAKWYSRCGSPQGCWY